MITLIIKADTTTAELARVLRHAVNAVTVYGTRAGQLRDDAGQVVGRVPRHRRLAHDVEPRGITTKGHKPMHSIIPVGFWRGAGVPKGARVTTFAARFLRDEDK